MTLGIAGTAKNTGKTTTTTSVLAQAFRRGVPTALTSIGFDGEDLDNVTRLPKPRILVEAGTWVAVAAGCLAAGQARISVTARTGVHTPLGEVLIGVVRSKGHLTLAGPNKRRELHLIIGLLKEKACPLCLVDGALNRIVPMVETDGLILATGAARTTDLSHLAGETGAIAELLAFPGVDLPIPPTVALRTADGRLEQCQGGSLFEAGDVRPVVERVKETTTAIFIPGVVTAPCLAELIERIGPRWPGKTLVFSSMLHILAFGRPQEYRRLLAGVEAYGGSVAVCRPLPLLAVTVNPFYPDPGGGGRIMHPAYVDAIALEQAVREKVPVPVIDVARSGAGRLWEVVVSLLRKMGTGGGDGSLPETTPSVREE